MEFKSKNSRVRRLFLRRRSRSKHTQNGSVAVEFSVVAIPFLLFIFSIMEVGWFYFVNASLDAAIVNAARPIRTGTVQRLSEDIDEQEDFFKASLCRTVGAFGDCNDILTYEVTNFPSISAAINNTDVMACPGDLQQSINDLEFAPGAEDDFVRIRLCLRYDTINPAIGVNLSESETSGKRNLQSVFYLRVERQTPEEDA